MLLSGALWRLLLLDQPALILARREAADVQDFHAPSPHPEVA